MKIDLAEFEESKPWKCCKNCERGFAKVCANWVLKQLTDVHKEACFERSLELLECYKGDQSFVKRTVGGNETWVHSNSIIVLCF